MHKPMSPVISYYGGKQRMAHNIIPLIPQHAVFVEPFCGGATILFKKPWPNVSNTAHYREVINDHDSRLINFYQQLRDHGEELISKIQLTPCSQKEHQEALREGLNCEDKLDAARRYYVNISQSFAYILNAGWRTSVYGRNEAATWASKLEKLPQYLERMISVHISCEEAIEVIKRWDSPQSFFYCDPPYPAADQGHYDGYTSLEFQNLIDALDQCQGSFLLSNYDQPSARIPADWERFEFSTTASSKGRVGYDRSKKQDESEQNRDRTEVVWRRFNRRPIRSELQSLFDSGAFDCFASRPKDLPYSSRDSDSNCTCPECGHKWSE